MGASWWDYDPGSVDGTLQPGTTEAIRQFQSDWEMEQTGEISDDLIAMLMHEHELTKPRMQKAENQDCLIQNTFPRARETVMFSGLCLEDGSSGKGKLIWRSMQKGEWVEMVTEGTFVAGNLWGHGTTRGSNGFFLEGTHRKTNSMAMVC